MFLLRIMPESDNSRYVNLFVQYLLPRTILIVLILKPLILSLVLLNVTLRVPPDVLGSSPQKHRVISEVT